MSTMKKIIQKMLAATTMFFSVVFFVSVLARSAYACEAHLNESTDGQSEYTQATIPGMSVSSAYVELCNEGVKKKSLIKVSTAIAKHAEIHTMDMQGDKMMMRQLKAIEIPAGECLQLQKGGKHIMLMGLLAPLKEGGTIDLLLEFDDGSQETKTLPILDKKS